MAVYGCPSPQALQLRAQLPAAADEAALLAAVRAVAPVRGMTRKDGSVRMEVELTGTGVPGASTAALERAVLAAAPGAEVFSIGERLDLVKQVGHPDRLAEQFGVDAWEGSHALGHTRLSTESRVDISHSQPFWAHGTPDLAVVHNGHITNYHRLRRRFEGLGYQFYTENDSEVLGPYLTELMKEGCSREEAMARSTRELDGTFCYLAASAEGLGFAKDFFCSKPLLLVETGEYVALATEEVALRRALPEAPAPVEPGANAARFWAAGEAA
jgi:glutamate synthase domain-containing protein 1